MNHPIVVNTPLTATATYDNNNEANTSKVILQKQLLAQQQIEENNGRNERRCGGGGSGGGRKSTTGRRKKRGCTWMHLNSLWSVWYGFFGTFLQAYIAVKCTKRFLRYSILPWTTASAIFELHVCLFVTGLAVLILPVFLAAAVFKVGNHANDGFKLGRGGSTDSQGWRGGGCSTLWRHGGPTAPFLHLVIAFSFLVPKLVMEARLLQAGFLPSDALWRTDLDFMVVHHDRLVVLSFMTATSQPNNLSTTTLNERLVGSGSSLHQSTTPIAAYLSPAAAAMESAPLSNTLNTSSGTNGSQGSRSPTGLVNSVVKFLKEFFHMEEEEVGLGTRNELDSAYFGSSVSVEYLNYALALLVYSVRYPAVFWHTNKCFGILFSIQLFANGLQSLLAFAGIAVLYKVQILGAYKSLPLLRHHSTVTPLSTKSLPFLLNPPITLLLFSLSALLILSTSLILYLYGWNRYNAFLNQHHHVEMKRTKECSGETSDRQLFKERGNGASGGSGDCQMFGKEEDLGGKAREDTHTNNPTFNTKMATNARWDRTDPGYGSRSSTNGYLTHCAALCALLATAVSHAPLLHDYTVVYRGSLDGAVLICIIAGISHLFLWVVVWLVLTVKQKWTFKIRITVGKATVRSARSLRLVTDIELASRPNNAHDGNTAHNSPAAQPLLIVGNGRAYAVTEPGPRKAIMSVVQKVSVDRQEMAKSSRSGRSSSTPSGSSEMADTDTDEQIYWLRPAISTPHHSPDSQSTDRLCWFGSRKSSTATKHKVHFNEASSTSNMRNNKTKSRTTSGSGMPDEDDGDYATLRELPVMAAMARQADDSTSEEGKLLACVHDDSVTYAAASTSRDLIPPVDYEDPSPLLTPEPLNDHDVISSDLNRKNTNNMSNITVHNAQLTAIQTPRCLRRGDSGMPTEEFTPRSNSLNSTTGSNSTTSPPEGPACSSHSETSSGVHSNASSSEHHPKLNSSTVQDYSNQQNSLGVHTNHIGHHKTSLGVHDHQISSIVVRNAQQHYKTCSLPQNSLGVHANQISSIVHREHQPLPPPPGIENHMVQKRATSVADLIQEKNESQWKSCSLQRNTQPPNPGYGNIKTTIQPQINSVTETSQNHIEQSLEAQTMVIQRNLPQTINPLYGYTTTSNSSQPLEATANHNPTGSVQKIVVQRNSQGSLPQTINKTNSIYGYTTANGFQPSNNLIMVPQPTEIASTTYISENLSNTTNGLYGYTKSTQPSYTNNPVMVSQPNEMNGSALSENGLYGYTKVSNGLVVNSGSSPVHFSPGTSTNQPNYGYIANSDPNQQIYGFTKKPHTDISEHGIPAVILENNVDNTVVIRRKSTKPSTADSQPIPPLKEEPFGRSTNMKMISFTEYQQNDLKTTQANSATLPHYPTQQPSASEYPHCSTMPLPHHSNQVASLATTNLVGSCNVFPRQHTTLPTHHNGVKLFTSDLQKCIYAKKMQN